MSAHDKTIVTVEQLAAVGMEEHAFFAGDGYSKVFRMPAGSVIGQHAHRIGHHSILMLGTAILKRQGRSIDMRAPCVVYLPAHVEHEVFAVTPVLWACNWPNAEGLTDSRELEKQVIA